MSEVSNGDIYNLLVNMRGDLGRLEGKVDGHAESLATQKANHASLDGKVQEIELQNARQRGFVAAISTVGAVIGTGLGAAVDWWARK